MFERYTERARRVIFFARYEASQLGSNSIEQARVFHQSFGLTGLVVTKLDGTSRGGAIVGIYRQLKIPIFFIGLGEQPDDLQPFSIENYSKAVFGLE